MKSHLDRLAKDLENEEEPELLQDSKLCIYGIFLHAPFLEGSFDLSINVSER